MPGNDAICAGFFELFNSRREFGLNAAEFVADNLKSARLKLAGESFIEGLKPGSADSTAAAVIIKLYIKRKKTDFNLFHNIYSFLI